MQLRCLLLIHSSGIATALVLLLALRALGADVTPAPSAMPTMPPPPTNEQVLKFVDAMVYELAPNSGKIVIDVIDASKMPAYDPLAHYFGMPDGKTPTIQLAGHLSASDADVQRALSRAFSLAVMDDGEAGTYWKELYDETAAKDATLPSSAPDPYRYRHELADVADAIMSAHKSSGKPPNTRQYASSRESLAPVIADVNQYAATTHFVGQSTIFTLDEVRATGEGYTLAHHVTVDGTKRRLMLASLRYHDTFVKTEGVWLFAERLLYVDWMENRDLS